MNSNFNYPFGRDGVDTMIVCHNDLHAKKVAQALQIKAYYTSRFSCMTGLRFDRIIVFEPDRNIFESEVERERFIEWMQNIRCKLSPGNTENLFLI